jgi:hypothetical protein
MSSIRKLGEKKYRIVHDAPSVGGKRKQKTETLDRVTKKQRMV